MFGFIFAFSFIFVRLAGSLKNKPYVIVQDATDYEKSIKYINSDGPFSGLLGKIHNTTSILQPNYFHKCLNMIAMLP